MANGRRFVEKRDLIPSMLEKLRRPDAQFPTCPLNRCYTTLFKIGLIPTGKGGRDDDRRAMGGHFYCSGWKEEEMKTEDGGFCTGSNSQHPADRTCPKIVNLDLTYKGMFFSTATHLVPHRSLALLYVHQNPARIGRLASPT